ncbi:hypothetical protein LPJ59_000163 [Coemansia sp. RSA 2399]|nr:hypothetical protein LPJ59_000163 [Coemansia sp. RSA 2399]KAJ1908184.1 hypothetical protein LPJ81_000260 [Coemansia sp. IMI 209127]
MNSKDIPSSQKHRKTCDGQQGERGVSLESESPTERLLAQSTRYTEFCELYPKALRDTVNENPDGAVLATRDPEVTRKAEMLHREKLRRDMAASAMDPEMELAFYPAAARRSKGGCSPDQY